MSDPHSLTRAARLSVAPMMDWTDSLCRQFHRVISRNALLYTEMVTSAAIVHGPRARLLDYDAAEHPLALQIGARIRRSSARRCASPPIGAMTRST